MACYGWLNSPLAWYRRFRCVWYGLLFDENGSIV